MQDPAPRSGIIPFKGVGILAVASTTSRSFIRTPGSMLADHGAGDIMARYVSSAINDDAILAMIALNGVRRCNSGETSARSS